MNSKKLLDRIHLWKNIQFVVCVLFQIAFILFIICNANFRYNVFANKSLFCVCLLMWISSLAGILFLIHDYMTMKELVLEEHALSKIAYLDDLTGIPNRYSCDQFLKNFTDDSTYATLGCGMITITNLKQINEEFDREIGDTIIQDFSNILDEASTGIGFVGRNGGNEFIVVVENCTSSDTMDSFFSILNDKISSYNKVTSHVPIDIKFTYILNKDAQKKNLSDLLTLVHDKLISQL